MPFAELPSLYSVWSGMRARCRNPNSPSWDHYGGRGIRICPEWDDYKTFERDEGPRPSLKHSLDRIDNDGPYAPWNCRWATRTEQNHNMSINTYVVIGGVRFRAVDFTEWFGIPTQSVVQRARAGRTFNEVLSTKPLKQRNQKMPPKAWQNSAAKRRARTHCKYGHEYTPENTHYPVQGGRACRTCTNERERQRRATYPCTKCGEPRYREGLCRPCFNRHRKKLCNSRKERHELTPDNLRITSDGRYVCLQCLAAKATRMAAMRARAKVQQKPATKGGLC